MFLSSYTIHCSCVAKYQVYGTNFVSFKHNYKLLACFNLQKVVQKMCLSIQKVVRKNVFCGKIFFKGVESCTDMQ